MCRYFINLLLLFFKGYFHFESANFLFHVLFPSLLSKARCAWGRKEIGSSASPRYIQGFREARGEFKLPQDWARGRVLWARFHGVPRKAG